MLCILDRAQKNGSMRENLRGVIRLECAEIFVRPEITQSLFAR